jgi:DMSO reductase family type II enzyme molybdopterin subunit
MSKQRTPATEDRYRDRVNQKWDSISYGTHCVNCAPADCLFYLFVKDGKVVREETAGIIESVEEGVPDMNPMLCQRGIAWSNELYAPERLRHPLRRAGERGEGKWEQISWDEALKETADALLDAIEEIGPESILMELSPEIGASIPGSRFMGVMGGTSLDVDGTINDFITGLQQTFGKFSFSASIDDAFHTEFTMIFHANPAYTLIPMYHFMVESRYAGGEIALVSPDVNPTHSHVDYHIPIRHGADAALALAMCQVIIEEDLVDREFVCAQTDLSLLVRTDTGEFLRAAHLQEDGRSDRFYHAHPEDRLVDADPAHLLLAFEPLLTGELEVELENGEQVTVEPLFARIKRQLYRDYRPEQVAETCDVHPDTIRLLARKVATRKTRFTIGMSAAKYYHGDLITRSLMLVLALTGNWGKKGTGTGSWNSFMFDGMQTLMSKAEAGVEGGKAVINFLTSMREDLLKKDPTLTGELADRELLRTLSRGGAGLTPPAFFWYHQAGYRERWNNRDWNDPDMKENFDFYFNAAVTQDTWRTAAATAANKPARVLIELGGNTLRRTRGGKKTVFENLWPQLTKVICADYRMSQTALHADIVLPMAQHYEKTAFGMPGPYTMFLSLGNGAVSPYEEAKDEWQMLSALCIKIAERAQARGMESFQHPGGERAFEDLWRLMTLDGTLLDGESVAREALADAVSSGNMPGNTTLDTFRKKGYVRYSNWAESAMAKANASPFPINETHAPLRNHVELGHPYPTLTRRAQFLLDHPWYQEAGEDIPCHKEPPAMGGDYPFKLSGGHGRWSNHAMNMTNSVLLETHRGKPFVLINDKVAESKGIADDAMVRVWNDVGEFIAPVRTSPAQRPEGLTIYNGFEGFMFPGGKGSNEVEPGMIKWLHLVGDYGHLQYSPTEWQPVPFDRCVNVACEPVD